MGTAALPAEHDAGRASRKHSAGRARGKSRTPAPTPTEVLCPIGALAKIAGVSTRTVRYYEEIRLLETARRFSGGRRVFGRDALERLRFIGRLKRLGFALDEIRHLNEVFSLQHSTAQMLQVLDAQLARHLAQLDERLREVTALRGDLGSYRRQIRERLAGLAVRALAQGANSPVRALARGANGKAQRRRST